MVVNCVARSLSPAHLRHLVIAGWCIAAAFVPALPAAAQSLPPANLCATPGHRQFDFWVGSWDVFDPRTDKLVAHSLIEKLYGGCAVRENWMPLKGSVGGSLNVYRPATRQWHQTWVDSGNGMNEYAGGMAGGKMELTGRATDVAEHSKRVRMTYERRSDGIVVQTGFNWSAVKRAWVLDYQLDYHPSR